MEAGFVECSSTNIPKCDVNMIIEFTMKNPTKEAAGSSKEQKSARPNYGDKAIGRVQLKRDGPVCTVKGRITPEHKMRATPYTVICSIDEEKEEILRCDCEDCPASAGGCKHRIAFLMWIHRRSEEPSPTEVTSYWKKAVLSSAGTAPLLISDISRRQEVSVPGPSTEVKEEFKAAILRQCSSQVAINVFSEPDDNNVADLHKLAQSCCDFDEYLFKIQGRLNDNVIKKIESETRDQSASPVWHLARYGRVTASKFYSVSHCKTNDGSVVSSILGEKIFQSEAMKRGSNLEHQVFQLIKTKFTNIKKCGLFLNQQYPLFGASPDGIGPDFVLEIKCPTSDKTFKKYVQNDRIQQRYLLQIQLQMAICGKKKGYFVVAHPGFEKKELFTLLETKYNHSLVQENVNKAVAYYRDNIFPHIL